MKEELKFFVKNQKNREGWGSGRVWGSGWM